MDGYKCVIRLQVRFADCDPLGHLNNARFFTFLEEARFFWFRTVFGEEGFRLHPIILGEARCTFRSAALPGETIAVGIRVEKIGRKSFTHGYRLVSEADGRLVAEAETVGVGFDYATQGSRELGEEFRRAIEQYQGSVA